MTTQPPSDRGRLQELLADRALHGLSPAECGELNRLLALRAGVDLESYELAAAAYDLALGPTEFEPLSPQLKAKLAADAQQHFAGARAQPASAQAPAPVRAEHEAVRPARKQSPRSLAWLAAAAALVLAVAGWWPRLVPQRAPDLVAQLDELAARPGATRLPWGPGPAVAGGGGELVWSNADQRGVMRIRGLPVNDPTREQYQLWIFDESRENPVDGGVFDVDRATGDVLVPIDAKLKVGKPTLFAVTIEQPGGVVVSKKERIALLAQG